MLKHRLWIAAALAWLLLFFNIERFHEPINIASFVYVLAALVAIVIVSVRWMQKMPLVWLVAAAFVTLLAGKWLLGYGIIGRSLPLTITEACAIGITVLLACGISRSIRQFEESTAHLMTMHLSHEPLAFDHGQENLYREVRRARDFQRPLALVTVSPNGKSRSATVNRFLRRVQRETIRRYIDASLADLLAGQLKDCDIITRSNDHFVLMLPESNEQRVGEVLQRVKAAASEELGLDLHVGVATFPEQEVTLSGLLQRAIDQMRSKNGSANGNGHDNSNGRQADGDDAFHLPAAPQANN